MFQKSLEINPWMLAGFPFSVKVTQHFILLTCLLIIALLCNTGKNNKSISFFFFFGNFSSCLMLGELDAAI